MFRYVRFQRALLYSFCRLFCVYLHFRPIAKPEHGRIYSRIDPVITIVAIVTEQGKLFSVTPNIPSAALIEY